MDFNWKIFKQTIISNNFTSNKFKLINNFELCFNEYIKIPYLPEKKRPKFNKSILEINPNFNIETYRNSIKDISNKISDEDLEYNYFLKKDINASKNYIYLQLSDNQWENLFNLASCYGIFRSYNKDLFISPHDLKLNLHFLKNFKIENKITTHEYEPFNSVLTVFPTLIKGNFFNESYFLKYKSEIIELFKIDNILKNSLIEKFPDIKQRYFIHIDKNENEDYYQESINYIKTNDTDVKFYIISNDYEYCKSLNWLEGDFLETLSEYELFFIMSLCEKGGICSNFFSWWGSYLNENNKKIVIFPNKNGYIGSKYFNSETKVFKTKRYDLSQTSIIIPLRIDHNDRLVNLKIVLTFLLTLFETTIILIENGEKSHYSYIEDFLDKEQLSMINYEFQYSNDLLFHRMKILNECLAKVKTPVVANYDIDCLIDINSYLECQNLILNNKYDVIHPFLSTYGVNYINIDIKEKGNLFNVYEEHKKYKFGWHIAGNGFIIFFNTEKYRWMGGENENFKSWGPEDNERIYRAKKLGLRYLSFPKKIYHLEHFRTENSNTDNPYFKKNDELFNYLSKLSDEDLKKYYNIK